MQRLAYLLPLTERGYFWSMLYHENYSRFQALEIIRESEFQELKNQGEDDSIANKCADAKHSMYSQLNNAAIEGCLEDLFDFRPTVTNS